MRIPSPPRRHVVSVVVGACALFAALLLTHPAPVVAPVKNGTPPVLVLTWVDDGNQLQVGGDGYRPNGLVNIRLGSEPIQQARAGKTGKVLVQVPQRLIAAGQPGASVIVAGRSRLGTSRTLISAVPPQAAGRSAIDALPWVVGALVLARLGLGVLRRRRRRPARRLLRHDLSPARSGAR